jgi:hypothetical protein
MATNIIVLKKPSGKTLISPGIVSTLDASGFDTVTARYVEQITANEVTKKYAPGAPGEEAKCPVTGGTMILMGATDTADLPGNCCEYTVTWRGLLTTLPGRTKQITENRSVRETVYNSITGIPNTGTSAVKARLLELQAGASIKEIVTAKPNPPSLASDNEPTELPQNPSRTYTIFNGSKTYCYPFGWICMSWQSEQPIPGIWFVTSEWKYEQPFGNS